MHQKTLSLVLYKYLLRPQKPANSNSGTSLIELLVVVALTALLAAFAAPAITFGRNPLRDSSNRIAANFKLARARAMASTSAIRIRPTLTAPNTQFVMERANRCSETNAANWTIISDQVVKDGQPVYEDLSLDSPAQLINAQENNTTTTNWSLCFDSRGQADKTLDLTFRDMDTNQTRAMKVFLGGAVDMGSIN